MATAKKKGDKAPATSSDKKADNQDNNQPPARVYTISAVAEAGFYRCGLFFPHEGRQISGDDLSDKQLAQLKAEPNLVVSE
ncbi:HI1506-related protein [Candidatus Sororendozoicomonas aggregata]|uniref:HI1506-related protein n=1 Tax=Candidatus Sororendozoicomonas aggregata TaxID=3073239 RepID=UPI002ED323C4